MNTSINNLEIHGSKSKTEVHNLAMRRFRQAELFESKHREEALDDLRFLDNYQWSPEDIAKRISKDRPYLTFNRLSPFVDQIVGDQQKAKFSIDVAAMSYKGLSLSADEGTGEYSIAQVYGGHIKSIEQNSVTNRARNLAFESQVSCGFGYYRVITDWVNEMSFDQEIRCIPIHNPFTVYLDPEALFKGPEYAEWGFITDIVNEDQWNRRHPKKPFPSMSPTDLRGMGMEKWWMEDGVRIAEYFVKEFVETELVQLNNGAVYRLDEYERNIDKFESEGLGPMRFKKVMLPQVFWYELDATGILDGPKLFPCRYIPIVPVYGKMRIVDGQVSLRGSIRYSKDAQRLYNYSETATAELISGAPKNQWMIDWDAVPTELREDYKKANLDNIPALYYSSKRGNKPEREAPANIQPGFAQLTERAWDNMKGTVGMFPDALGEDQTPLVTGKAVMMKQQPSESISYPFIQNYTQSLEYEGKIYADLIPNIYDSQRTLKLVMPDDAEVFMTINKSEWNPETESYQIVNELTHADLLITVNAGPSQKTQRMNAVESLTRSLEVVAVAEPRVIPALLKLISQNSDFTGAKDLALMMDRIIDPQLTGNQDVITPQMAEIMVQQAVEQALQEAGVDLAKFEAETERIDAFAKRVSAMARMIGSRTDAVEVGAPTNIPRLGVQVPAKGPVTGGNIIN